MLKMMRFLLASTALVIALPLMADDLQCGDHYISGDQIEPLTREQVVEKCGEPTSKAGYHWYYKKQGKVLVFNSDGALVTIRDAQEQ